MRAWRVKGSSARIGNRTSPEGKLLSNDAARRELAEVLALVQEQIADFADLQKKRATLTATASVADGAVAVTVDAQGTVIKTIIDESYLDEYDFADLGDHVTAAARDAARAMRVRSEELLRPLAERRRQFPPLSDIVDGIPDLDDLMPEAGRWTEGETKPSDIKQDWEGPGSYPIVRRT